MRLHVEIPSGKLVLKIVGAAFAALLLCANEGSAALPRIGGCTVFTADDDWNKDISGKPVDWNWTSKLNQTWGTSKIKAVFGTYRRDRAGMPVNIVPATQPKVPITFDQYARESDRGPYPFPGPNKVYIQGGDPTCPEQSDCHVLVVQQGSCKLYEGWACHHTNGRWYCGSGAVFDLKRNSYGQRPMWWTSADAGGLPMAPGVLRYAEAASGVIPHALRIAVGCTSTSFIRPASHGAAHPACGNNLAKFPPLGLRLRLKKNYDISRFSPLNRTILQALKKHGAIIADNNPGFPAPVLYGDVDPRWGEQLYELWNIPASAFEAVVTYQ